MYLESDVLETYSLKLGAEVLHESVSYWVICSVEEVDRYCFAIEVVLVISVGHFVSSQSIVYCLVSELEVVSHVRERCHCSGNCNRIRFSADCGYALYEVSAFNCLSEVTAIYEIVQSESDCLVIERIVLSCRSCGVLWVDIQSIDASGAVYWLNEDGNDWLAEGVSAKS